MTTSRRTFLRWTTLGTAVGVVPGGLALVGCRPANAPELQGLLDDALARGRALVVVLIPEDAGVGLERGELWGAFLNHGTDSELAELAACDLICAPLSLVQALDPDATMRATAETVGFVFDARGRAQAIECDAPPMADHGTHFGPDDFEAISIQAEAADRVSIGALARSLDAALAQERAARRKVEASSLSADQARALARVAAGEDQLATEHATELVSAAPAALFDLAAEAGPPLRSGLHALLADAARSRYVRKRPQGAHWTNAGCGQWIEDYEGPDQSGVSCGMGFSPGLSTRFLNFYAREG